MLVFICWHQTVLWMLASLAVFVVLPNWLLMATGRLVNNWSSKLISHETPTSKVTPEQFLTEPFKEEDDNVQSTTLEFIREEETDDPATTTTSDSSLIFPTETESIPTSTAPTVRIIDDEQHREEQQEATTLFPLQPTAPAVHPIDKTQQQPVMEFFINIQPVSWTQYIVQIFSSSSNDNTIPFFTTLLSNLIQWFTYCIYAHIYNNIQ